MTFLRAFKKYKGMHQIFQYLIDIGVGYAALLLTDYIFENVDILTRAWDNFELVYAPALIFTMIVFFSVNDVYEYSERRLDEIVARVIASLVKSMAILFVMVYFINLGSSRKMLLVFGALVAVFYLVLNILRWHIYSAMLQKRNTLLIAHEMEAKWLLTRIQSRERSVYNVNCWVENFSDFDRELLQGVKTVILGTGFSSADTAPLVDYCILKNIELVFVPSAFGILSNGISMRTVDDIMVFVASRFRLDREQQLLKRLLDVIISAAALLVLSPFMLVVAAAVKLDSPGPVFYRQPRVGYKNREFNVIKFRSMCNNAEKHTGAVFARKNDSRLTKVGNFIRKTRLDEVPQFINVLRGDMSVVGPRPERRVFVDEFEKRIPFYRYRHYVKPGITGMAQIYGKYNTAPEFKILFDLYYITRCQKWGVLLSDISIMLQTLSVFFNRNSAEGAFDIDTIRIRKPE